MAACCPSGGWAWQRGPMGSSFSARAEDLPGTLGCPASPARARPGGVRPGGVRRAFRPALCRHPVQLGQRQRQAGRDSGWPPSAAGPPQWPVVPLPAGALQIESSEETDQGKYECVATNSAGVRYSSPANLYVRGRERGTQVPAGPRLRLPHPQTRRRPPQPGDGTGGLPLWTSAPGLGSGRLSSCPWP